MPGLFPWLSMRPPAEIGAVPLCTRNGRRPAPLAACAPPAGGYRCSVRSAARWPHGGSQLVRAIAAVRDAFCTDWWSKILTNCPQSALFIYSYLHPLEGFPKPMASGVDVTTDDPRATTTAPENEVRPCMQYVDLRTSNLYGLNELLYSSVERAGPLAQVVCNSYEPAPRSVSDL